MSTETLTIAKLIKAAGVFDEPTMMIAGQSLSTEEIKTLKLLLRKYHGSLKNVNVPDEKYAKIKKDKKQQKISREDKFKKYVFCLMTFVGDYDNASVKIDIRSNKIVITTMTDIYSISL